MTKLSMLIFQSPSIKPSLEICLIIPKEGIVTILGTGLTVPSCKGPSTMMRNPTYAVLSRNEQYCELHVHEGGGSRKVTSDDEGEGGGGGIPPKNDDVIYEQPLSILISAVRPASLMHFFCQGKACLN